ncbi:DKNYY domain-containing protein [Chryseobacterium rhizosphaerae]|uniref:DKNYY family protein n=1 Tax=Chryseobacterium rhizosphaerae TaxID=395937 RepID=A0ABX9IJV6_9FLAO|nr:DKNYY domain-containing protein [Chryseobacterium rhizosphaerae]REC75140.1 hypothetical protein DRF57_12395 [Chryseobacterium rhizosphaerae]
MKCLIFIFPLIFSIKTNAQTIVSIKKPVVNPVLSVYDAPNLEANVYLINKDYIVFQGNEGIRHVTSADTKSFSVHKVYDEMARNKDGIFVEGNFVKTDTLGFKYIGTTDNGHLWKTKTKIYKNLTELTDLTASEFISLKDSKGNYSSYQYYQYKDQVYYYDKLVKDIDVNTIVFLDWELCYDKNGFYDRGEKVFFEGTPVTYLTPYLQKAKNHVLNRENILSGSDADSFIKLHGDYAKDKNLAYHGSSIVRGADAASFVSVNEHFAKDKNHVYSDSNAVPDADPNTFVLLDKFYFRDKNHVYYQDQILPIDIADAGKLKIWNTDYVYTFIMDGKKVFLAETLLDKPKFDAPSFGVIADQALCYDKNGIYISSYDAKTNEVLYKKIPFNYSGAVDRKDIIEIPGYIFYKDQAYSDHNNASVFNYVTQEHIDILKNKNKDLIKINGSVQFRTNYDFLLGKVGNNVYWNDKKTSADAETFENIKDTYYKDKNNVYFYSYNTGLTTLKGIDPGSVRVFNTFLADKDYIYTKTHRIIKSKNIELLAAYEGSWPMCAVGNPVSSTYYVFKNAEGYWLALISDKSVEINEIPASDPNLKQLLEIR